MTYVNSKPEVLKPIPVRFFKHIRDERLQNTLCIGVVRVYHFNKLRRRRRSPRCIRKAHFETNITEASAEEKR